MSLDRLRLAKGVAARWTARAAAGDFQPKIAADMQAWVERQASRGLTAKDYMRELELLQLRPDNTFTPATTPEEDSFVDAKTSIEVMLPKLLATLGKKFRDKFYMRATQQRLKLYYYFSGHPALETVALSLTMRSGTPTLWLAYVPHKLVGGADYAKAIQDQVSVRDPEMAGLALMRLLRGLLAKVPE